jgi:hypothetical protein
MTSVNFRRVGIRTSNCRFGARSRVQSTVRSAGRVGQGPLRRGPQSDREVEFAKTCGEVHKVQDFQGQGQGSGRDRYNEPVEAPEAVATGCGV